MSSVKCYSWYCKKHFGYVLYFILLIKKDNNKIKVINLIIKLQAQSMLRKINKNIYNI